MKITYIYYNWKVVILNKLLTLECRIGNDNLGYQTITREYNLPKTPKEVEFEGTELNINMDKIEIIGRIDGENFVADLYKNSEYIDSFANYSFWDDFNLEL